MHASRERAHRMHDLEGAMCHVCRYNSNIKKDSLLERGIDPGIPCVEDICPHLYPTTTARPRIGRSSQIRQSKRTAYINCLFLRYMRP